VLVAKANVGPFRASHVGHVTSCYIMLTKWSSLCHQMPSDAIRCHQMPSGSIRVSSSAEEHRWTAAVKTRGCPQGCGGVYVCVIFVVLAARFPHTQEKKNLPCDQDPYLGSSRTYDRWVSRLVRCQRCQESPKQSLCNMSKCNPLRPSDDGLYPRFQWP